MSTDAVGGSVEIRPVRGLPEVAEGDDIAAMIATALPDLADGDIVVVSSKIVSKAEGRVVPGTDRTALIESETVRVVAERGPTKIVQTRHGFVMAAAGIDNSNVSPGSLVLLPVDPDASAREIRSRLPKRVGVIVTDTFGRPWRLGQTDLAVGAAGVQVLDDHGGRRDRYGNELAVTAPAYADELAAAGDLVKRKLSHVPVALVRGLSALVTPEDGPGVRAVVRPAVDDMFRLGSREAVAEAAVLGRTVPELADGPVDGEVVRRVVGSVVDAFGPVDGLELITLEDVRDRKPVLDALGLPTFIPYAVGLFARPEPAVLLAAGALADRLALGLTAAGLGVVRAPGDLSEVSRVITRDSADKSSAVALLAIGVRPLPK